MRSRRACSRVVSVDEDALDPRHPLGELVEVTAQRRDSRVLPRVVSAWPGCLMVGDEHSAARVGLHELFLAEHVERVADGHRRDSVAAGQVAAGRQAIPWLERPAGDARSQVVGHLHVGRPRVVRVRLHLSRVRRPSYLGAQPTLQEGLRPRPIRSSVFYIALVQSSQEMLMALLGPFPVEFGAVFPSGAFAAGASRESEGLR